jgi:hypothetical protein
LAKEDQDPSMSPRTLTVLVPIRRGEEESLRDLLRPIGDDIKGKRLVDPAGQPRIEFQRSRRIHFARFAIFADPDRGPDRKRLLYSANYDGDLEDHLAELMAITSDPAAIWGRCEGYAGPHEFAPFIRAHTREPDAFYIAFREQTADSIRDASARRRHLQTLVDPASAGARAAVKPHLPSPLPGPMAGSGGAFDTTVRFLAKRFRRLVRALPLVGDLFRAAMQCGVVNVVRAALQIVASLNRYPLFRVLNRLTGNRMPPQQSPYSSVPLDNCVVPAALAPSDGLISKLDQPPPTFREDVVTQNQLTLVTVVKPGHVLRVRAVMAAIDAYAKRLAPPGSLIGISTIHFVKWLLIDDGRRLLMISDYDGSWESYIDEFAEMILSGLDAIWDSSDGYPPDGARDLPAFKWFLRSHQVASEVFFSAYPDQTVLNIVNDLALARECANLPIAPRHGLAQRL